MPEFQYIGLRVDAVLREYFEKYKPYSQISEVIRNILHEYIESQDPKDRIKEMVLSLERGESDPKVFYKWFKAMEERMYEKELMYHEANKLIGTLKEKGIYYQVVNKMRLQDEKHRNDLMRRLRLVEKDQKRLDQH